MMTLSAAPTQHLNKSRCSESVASSFTKFKYMLMLNGSSLLLLLLFGCRKANFFFVCSLSYETLNGRRGGKKDENYHHDSVVGGCRRKTEHRESNEANKSGGAVRVVTVARRLFSGCKNAKRCCFSLDSDFLR